MPRRFKNKKKLNKRNNVGMTSDQTPANSSGPQGNHEVSSSDHPVTDEDFSQPTAMESQLDPQPKSEPELESKHEAESESQPEHEAALSEDVSAAPNEQKDLLEAEQAEIGKAEPSVFLDVGEQKCEGTEIPVAAAWDVPAAGAAPLLVRRAKWWNCCGLFEVLRASQR